MSADAVQDMQAADLNLLKLGDLFFRLPLIAAQLGHVSLEETRTYLHASESNLEAQYAIDLLDLLSGRRHARGLTVEEFADRWFDGMDGAMVLLHRMFDRASDSSHDATHEGSDSVE